ncbi:MAG: hypothetical protein NC223_11225 [Butyrivibrio sp.]|nr:hypothetical protein [Butyrivibrio sp.]
MKGIRISADVIEMYSKVLEKHIYEFQKIIDKSENIFLSIRHGELVDDEIIYRLHEKTMTQMTKCIEYFNTLKKRLDDLCVRYMEAVYAPPGSEVPKLIN